MTYELDARRMGRLQVHEYLMEMLPLPDYYGRNLDALYDCLTDFCDITLTVTHSDEAPQSFDIVREVLMDAARENPDLTVIFQKNDISDT